MSAVPVEGSPPAPPRVELGTAAITTHRSTLLPRLAMWAAGLATLATAFIKRAWPAYKVSFEDPIPGFKWSVYNRVETIQPYAELLKVLGVATVALICFAAVTYFFTRKQMTYGGLRIEGDDVVLLYSDKPGRRIAISDIVGVDETNGVLELRDGQRIEITGSAREALSAELAKRRPKRDTLRVAMPFRRSALGDWAARLFPWVGWLALFRGANDAGTQVAQGSFGAAILFAGLLAAWLGVSALVAREQEITIGSDGVRLGNGRRAQLIPFADVKEIEVLPLRLALRLRNGKAVPLARQNIALERRLREAFDSYRAHDEAPADAHAHLLKRRDKSRDDWRADLKKLAHTQDYRAEGLDADTLATVVGDARADPEQRVAAALALPKSDEARARIRVAAASSADEDVQRALEAAALDELAEAELARAMKRRATS